VGYQAVIALSSVATASQLTWFAAVRILNVMRMQTLALAAAFLILPPVALPDPAAGSELKVPRFVSLRFATVNLRAGPGTQYPIDWVYKRRGMPVEVIRDLDNWRHVRDRWGTVGWIHVSNLSGKRTALIDRKTRTLRRKPTEAAPVARAQAGVIAKIRKCVKAWCRVSAAGRTGWVQRTSIWGVYKTEQID